ncbi:MAG: hypothetical protein NTZ61_12700 [Proteobacteria bacterium]|nr:hypothetical protein [Pseudomonadota bacterium]
MILRMLRSTEWGQLLDFVSPSFFEVLSARGLAGAARDLIASSRDDAGMRTAAGAIADRIGARSIPIRLDLERVRDGSVAAKRSSRDARIARGQLVLRLYFEQLLGADASLLDLRGARFTARGDSLVWSPARGFVRWDPAFLDAIRRMYRGFYADDDAAFRTALAALHLDAAADLFLDHFGAGEQTAVRFEMARFTKSFHAVFVRCRERGVRLHPNFVPLGVYLAALYEHLEGLDVPLDVRAAFAAAST